MNDNQDPGQNPKLLGAEALLEELFSADNRPSVYWLRDQRHARKIPYVRIGRKIFYEAEEVRKALRKNYTVRHLTA